MMNVSSGMRPRVALVRTALAVAACSVATMMVAERMVAESPATSAGGSAPVSASASMFRLDSELVSPAPEFRYRTAGLSSSNDAVEAERLSLGSMLSGAGEQPPTGGRRRTYGRSRYQDRMHNADGSSRIAFMAGAGLNVPVGNTGKFYTPSYDFAAGAGLNFNKMFGVLGEFHYDHMGVTGGAINAEYNRLLGIGATPTDLLGFDANARVLSVTVDPVVNFSNEHSKIGAYVTGGVGYYHKTTNFTLPSCGVDYFGYTFCNNYNIDSAGANAFGANFGAGLTYKISDFSSERLFIEGRYNWLKINSSNNTDFFPYNRRNSEYVPVLVGIRF